MPTPKSKRHLCTLSIKGSKYSELVLTVYKTRGRKGAESSFGARIRYSVSLGKHSRSRDFGPYQSYFTAIEKALENIYSEK